MDAGRAFDFQSIEAAQRFWRENQLVRVRIAFVAARRSKSASNSAIDEKKNYAMWSRLRSSGKERPDICPASLVDQTEKSFIA